MAVEIAASKPVDAMSFEEAVDSLKAGIERLESGELTLDEVMGEYERCGLLRQRAAGILEVARQRMVVRPEAPATPPAEDALGGRGEGA